MTAGTRHSWMIVPASPERFDGVRDFARHLAAALADAGPVQTFTTRDDRDPAAGTTALSSWRALDATGKAPQAIYLNYVPQLWLRRDLPFLLSRLGRLRKSGTRLVFIVHEYQLDPRPSLTRRAARVLFRAMARAFASRAHAIVTSHGYVAGLVRADRLDTRAPIVTIPVGSNIGGDVHSDASGRRGVVMFGQPAGMSPLLVAAAARAVRARGLEVVWICRREDEAREWLARHDVPADAIRIVAGLDDRAVSRTLSSAAVGCAPNDDGASTRRTSVAALLQHGLPVVGTDGRATDRLLRDSGAFTLVPADDPAAAEAAIERLLGDDAARARMGEAARALFEAHLSWPRIAARYAQLST